MTDVKCPVCAGTCAFLDLVDGNRSCEEMRGFRRAPSDWQVAYYLCDHCGFCFAPEFSAWSSEDFRERIYNADYVRIDPDYLQLRPVANAQMLLDAFGSGAKIRHLDYGGGNGRLSARLVTAGWQSRSFDPFERPAVGLSDLDTTFELITAFEVIEHVADPEAFLVQLSARLATPGLILFSTLVTNGHISPLRKLDWWYAAPRNGHISLFSIESLRRLGEKNGLHFRSLSAGLHVFWRKMPIWAAKMGASTLLEQPMTSTKAIAQADQLAAEGKITDAVAAYRQIVQTDPKAHSAWHALGLFAFKAGNVELAVQYMEAAIASGAKIPLYHRNIGEIYRRAGQLVKAVKAGRHAIQLAPDDIDAQFNLGLAYSDAKHFTKAIRCYRKALKLNPEHGLSWNNLGSALEHQGDLKRAEAAYAKAVALNPSHAEAQNNLGAIFSECGRLDEARACFEAAIKAKADFVEAHYNLSSLKTYTADDPHLAMLEAVFPTRANLGHQVQIRFNFALGKALDDIGAIDRAFAAYDEGNLLQHRLLPFDESRADAMLARIIEVFDEEFFEARQHWRGSEKSPIFIVGMPRSGTTLLEQILSSHPSVFGAGELVDLNEVVNAATGADPANPFTDGVRRLSATDILQLGDEYAERVWKYAPDSAFITDKMPANFFYLGIIHLALPNARIIHVVRDPMDSCFSCYSHLFNDTMEFAYDQGTLGRYCVRYMKLMQHWQRVLPTGRILDLRYEDMVADPEAQTRRVLDFVGLPWEQNCLRFHENRRPVKTASIAQVRKPIYRSSVARWKLFARHLRPLYELVKEYRPDDGAAQLFPAAADTPEQLHLNGIALYKQGRFVEALAYYDQALASIPAFPAALNSKGFVLQDLDRLQEAMVCFERAVSLAPGFAMARLNLGMVQLKLGLWQSGWENYEARWLGSAEAGNGRLCRPVCPLPQWNGEVDTHRKRLLVITEQGFGDTLQFARYLALASQRFAQVGFVCSPATLRLMEWSFADNIVTFTRLPANYAIWDFHCPLLSLPRAFATRPDTIPQNLPYLRVPEKAATYWRDRLNATAPGGLRIGIAWAGRRAHQYDERRSLRFEQLLPLLIDKDITWVSLQKWAVEEDRPAIPESIDWIDWTEELNDFADSAALVCNLDLVISIDSAMVHLAGALNRPVWMLNRFDSEWRWFAHRNDSPWYPRLRIFNQPAFGDWPSVLAKVQLALAELPNRGPRGETVRSNSPARVPDVAPLLPSGIGDFTIEQGIQLASQHQSAGRFADAERILGQILRVQPRHAHALHLLGIVAYLQGRIDAALSLMEQAVAIDDGVALFHSNLAEMNRQQGCFEAAIRFGERAIYLDPSMASAHGNLGIAYYDAKDFDRAETCHQNALRLTPTLLPSLNNLGSIYRARKELAAAAGWYRKALAINPDYLEALSNLGAVLVESDLAEDARIPLEHALQLQPAYVEALCNLGLAHFKLDHFELAIGLLQRSLQLRPDYPEALIGLARTLAEQERMSEAEVLLRRATEKSPGSAEAWSQLGTVLTEQGSAIEADAAYAKALNIDPTLSDALAGLGNLRLEAGKMDDAETLIKQAIVIKPDNLGARFQLTQARKVQAGDDNLAALESWLTEGRATSDEKKISLHYALGKAYDDLEEYDRAFHHFMEGARLKRAKLVYDADAESRRCDRIIEIFDATFFARMRGAGVSSNLPVFVLGMPRSGTTLTEQIIASHPAVYGAGELRDLMDIVQQSTSGRGLQAFPDNLLGLTPATLATWGRDYAQRLRQRAPDAIRVTDKMPGNYLALGLIPLILPQSKIVHVRRNPVDTCLSCFTRLFNRHQEATYDLAELGRHYVNYERLMQHWRTVLPQGSFIDVQYEDIVADMNGQARRLIDYCGLEWNDACLAFYNNKRNIRTASVTQVRQPIYTRSVDRWRHYEKFLGPLLVALGREDSGR